MTFLPRPAFVLTALVGLSCLAAGLTACQDPFGHTVTVKAQYLRLTGHSVAVVVSVPDHILDPDAANDIGKAVTQRIAEHVKGVNVMPYSRVQAFVEANPYWTLRPPSTVQKALGVDRLVMVDVADFRLHEEGAGNDLLQGLASGHIRVLEAEGLDPDRFAFGQAATAQYPSLLRSPLGLPEGHNNLDAATVRHHLIQIFSLYTAGTFYDHEETR